MSTFSVPYVFVDGTTASAAQVNANFNALIAAGNNINSVNLGGLGIYASQIVPTSAAQATFGGTLAYTFPAGLAVSGAVSATGFTANTSIYGASFCTVNGALSAASIAATGGVSATSFTAGASVYGSTSVAIAGSITATSFVATAAGVAFSLPNFGGGSNATAFAASSTLGVTGTPVTGSALLIAAVGVKNLLALDYTGALGIGAAIYQNSKRASKNHIAPLEPGQASRIVDATTIVRYAYKDENADGPRHIGFIAEDTPADISAGGESMEVGATICVALQAIKELRAEFAAYVAAHA